MNEAASDWAWTTSARAVAKHVLLTLAQRCQPGVIRCAPSLAELSHMNGYGITTIRRALRDLEAEGLIAENLQVLCGTCNFRKGARV